MRTVLDLAFLAPIPVGHRVTVLALEHYATPLSLFGPVPEGSWRPMEQFLVCDEDTHVLYSDRSIGLHVEASYEHIRFIDDTRRVSSAQAPMRGRVSSCVVLSDHGERTCLRTLLGVDVGT
jgi:hypothetical protein